MPPTPDWPTIIEALRATGQDRAADQLTEWLVYFRFEVSP